MVTGATRGNLLHWIKLSGDHFRHTDGHSKILGYCFDGYPIYGPYGYSDYNDPSSTVVRMTSSYQYFSTEPTGRGFLYGAQTAGTFVNDRVSK